jgi:branched-chain amino acid transport system substrate-binding protein
MGAGLSRHVHTLFSGSETPFVVNDLGGDPLMTDGPPNPYMFCNTLNIWQSMYALGWWASQHVGSRACVAAALHEAGYGIVHAFWLGFCAAGGGTILATEVTHRKTPDDDASEQVGRLVALQPDFVMAFYSGREGISFAKAWRALGLAGPIPLLASPLMTHDFWLQDMPDVAGVRSAFSWDMDAHPDEHAHFRRICARAEGREPAVFALLGYETGRMLCAAVTRAGQAVGGRALREALAGVEYASPRGVLRLDPETGEVGTVDCLVEVRRGDGGTMERGTVGPLTLPPSYRGDYDAIRQGGTRSGWFNPYLIT